MFIFRNKRVESISPETTFVKANKEETLEEYWKEKGANHF